MVGLRASTATQPPPVSARLRLCPLRHVHCAIDDHTRLPTQSSTATSRPTPAPGSCAGFLRRAAGWFAEHSIERIERVMTDNAMSYRRSHAWREALLDIGTSPQFTAPYRPQTNGKACEDLASVLHWPRSDPGEGVTTVSCVRFVGRCWCSAVARTGQTDLT
jgi:hypothetical protein